MRVRALCAALVCMTAALPAQAVADHGIAAAVRSSGESLPAGSGGQASGGALVAGLRTTPGSLEQVGHSRS
jgi:hypothetical protein